ncbi:hypothetical protein [Flavobacterium sp. SM2513]|uniref:hypothetical protein n=1 Tax=Flavobacterium sp. SM2513 TaxID=3424766 RepID=UPI003D7FC0F8
MEDFELCNVDPEDVNDLLLKVESSFGVKFVNNELLHIDNFGEFCTLVTNKIQLKNVDNCTSQQAFYKLRKAIAKTLQLDSDSIFVNSLLINIFPRKDRRLAIRDLEVSLGFKLKILKAPNWLTLSLGLLLLVFVILLFFYWKIAIVGIVLSLTSLKIVSYFGKEFIVDNVGQLAKKISREDYVHSRSDAETFNKNEVEVILREWFVEEFALDESKFNSESKFI